MTHRWAATYSPSAICNQPNTKSGKEPRGTVSLTPAETRVVYLLPTYRTLAAIGTQLGIGRPTVKTHVENIYKKLGATTRAREAGRARRPAAPPVTDLPASSIRPHLIHGGRIAPLRGT
jgi:DNA-binding CsgD family transcriptional regulator